MVYLHEWTAMLCVYVCVCLCVAMQKRAMLAAQLADNKIATQALSSAPEQLR